MKVLVTASTFAHIRAFHIPYIKGFHDAGWEVDVACGGVPAEIPYVSKRIVLPMEKRMLSAGNLKSMLKMRREIRKRHYDLVICHTSLAAFYTRLAVLTLGKPCRCINVVHGYLFNEGDKKLKSCLLKVAELLLAAVTDKVLAMNHYDYMWAKRHRAGKELGFILGMGADEKRTEGTEKYDFTFEDDAFILIYPAEFSARKNQGLLIDALAELPPRVKLVLPGEGALLDQCKKQAVALEISDRVLFPGYVEKIVPWIKGADVAVTSSRSEGLPFNVLEAMQCGLPVIASRAKGNTELVKDGVNGYLFENAGEFAGAVRMLMERPDLAVAMGRAGRGIAEKYSLKNVYPQMMDEYMR